LPATSRPAVEPRRSSPAELAGARRAPLPQRIEPQLATLVDRPPEGDHWLNEVKFDGYRMCCRIDNGKVRFISRTGNDWTLRLSNLVEPARSLPAKTAMLDGEVVVLDAKGISRFQLLQNAFRKGSGQFVFYAFDLMHLDGRDLTHVPLLERKAALAELIAALPKRSRIRYSEHVDGMGLELYKHVCEAQIEGMIAKRGDAPYTPGRSDTWLKVKCRLGQELVVGGFTEPAGSRHGFGSLLLGYYRAPGQLVFAGRVGTGFDARLLSELRTRLDKLEQADSPFEGFPRSSRAKGIHWVRPVMVVQVEFANWTDDGLVRQASFVGVRDDKRAKKIKREVPAG
jgi:bifunctional non-homologous end joining protein LigD